MFAALRTRGFPSRLARLGIELLRVLAPRAVNGWMRFGFEDPVSTGVILGIAQAAAWQVRLEPDFTGPALTGHAHIAWAVRPGAVLWPVGTFVASPTMWRAARAAARAK